MRRAAARHDQCRRHAGQKAARPAGLSVAGEPAGRGDSFWTDLLTGKKGGERCGGSHPAGDR